MNTNDELIDLFCDLCDLQKASSEAANVARKVAQRKSYDEGYADGCEAMCSEISDRLARIIRKTTPVPEGTKPTDILRRELCRH